MNMKNTVILLIFLLSVLGLIIGVHYTEDIGSVDSDSDDFDSVSEDSDSVLSADFEKHDNNYISQLFTKKN